MTPSLSFHKKVSQLILCRVWGLQSTLPSLLHHPGGLWALGAAAESNGLRKNTEPCRSQISNALLFGIRNKILTEPVAQRQKARTGSEVLDHLHTESPGYPKTSCTPRHPNSTGLGWAPRISVCLITCPGELCAARGENHWTRRY